MIDSMTTVPQEKEPAELICDIADRIRSGDLSDILGVVIVMTLPLGADDEFIQFVGESQRSISDASPHTQFICENLCDQMAMHVLQMFGVDLPEDEIGEAS